MNNTIIKSIVVALFLLHQLTALSQNKLGVFAGPQIVSAHYTIKENKQPVNSKVAFQAGATLKVPFEGNLYFAPAMYYSLKGYEVSFLQPSLLPSKKAINNNVKVHTVETALLLQYDLSKNPSHFFVKGGPAIDFALSGKEKFDTTAGAPPINRKMTFSFGDYGLVTAQAIAIVGYETKNGLFGFVHYAHGLGSLNNADGGPQIKHRIWGLSVGYYFKHKK